MSYPSETVDLVLKTWLKERSDLEKSRVVPERCGSAYSEHGASALDTGTSEGDAAFFSLMKKI